MLQSLAQSGSLAHNAQVLAPNAVPTDGWVIEPKLDGWRLIAHVHDTGVTTYARSGNTYTGRLPHVEAWLADRFPAGTWLDGEAVAFTEIDGQVVNDWGTAQSVLTKLGPNAAAAKAIRFHVFDLIAHAGIDARPLKFGGRREVLEMIFADVPADAPVQLVAQAPFTVAAHEAHVAAGWEGSMVKALSSPYASGKRGVGQVKLKPQVSVEAVVMGFKPGENGFAGMVGAIEFGQYVDGVLTHRGRCSGMNMAMRKAMTSKPEKWVGTVIEVKHMGVMESGALRHPQFARARADRSPESVVWADA